MRAIKRDIAPVCAGIDIGHGRVKIVSTVTENITFQSTAAPVARCKDLVSHGGSTDKPVMVGHEPWLVGRPSITVSGSAQAISKGAHLSDEHYALFLEAIGRIGCDIDSLYVGTTVDQIGFADKIKAKLQGEHQAHGKWITIRRVGVCQQPRGAARMYLETLDEVEDHSFLVLDPGEGTTDINLLTAAVTDDDEIIITVDREAAMTEWVGVSQVSERVARELGGAVTTAQVSSALWRQKSTIDGVPLAPLVEQEAEPIARQIATSVKSRVRNMDSVRKVLLVGGGAHIFGSHFKRILGGRCEVMVSPSFANAEGFCMMAEDYAEAP